jgi:mono/diheme cytochrome c family protein
MYDQPRYKPLSGSSFFANGQSARPLVEGTVAHGHERIDSLLYTGKVHGQPVDLFPYQVTDSIVRRGRDRFDIFCSPCHGRRGDGDGMIVRRGFPQPPSFLADSIRAYPAGFYFDVVTNGFGRMYSYASRVPVRDRWAIVAYIRALQLSRRVSVADLSATERKRLQETK